MNIYLKEQTGQILTFDKKTIKMLLFELNAIASELVAVYFLNNHN
jgi:hypothetical protein